MQNKRLKNVFLTLIAQPEKDVPGGQTRTTRDANLKLFVELNKHWHHLKTGHQHVTEQLITVHQSLLKMT